MMACLPNLVLLFDRSAVIEQKYLAQEDFCSPHTLCNKVTLQFLNASLVHDGQLTAT